MTPENLISLIRGNTQTVTTEFIDDVNDTPINITGATVYFTVKNSYDDPDSAALIAKTVTSHTDPTNGETQFVLSATDTDIEPREYYYDLKIQFMSGTVNSIQFGKFRVLPSITRRL